MACSFQPHRDIVAFEEQLGSFSKLLDDKDGVLEAVALSHLTRIFLDLVEMVISCIRSFTTQ